MKRKLKILYTVLLLTASSLGLTCKANPAAAQADTSFRTASDTLSIEVMHARKSSNHLVTNPSSNGIVFTNSLNNHPLEFFVFDLEGTLIHQTVLNPKEKRNITALKKGVYLYDLFFKDESIERGKITIK